jgi:tRNA pseudouridine38/39 synthase
MPRQYETWSKEDLIRKVIALERQTKSLSKTSATPLEKKLTPRQRSGKDHFDFSAHPKRKIALKFCYSGWEYNGLAAQTVETPLPTVEEVLFNALATAHLIDPEAGYEGCGWEKCGRTDRGVSAAGQVISLWVRSALKPAKSKTPSPSRSPSPERPSSSPLTTEPLEDGFGSLALEDDVVEDPKTPKIAKSLNPQHEGKREFDYVANLNRLLPATIRILAWSPVSEDFSARFNCSSRYYKYFFSSRGLSIQKMQEAANLLVGDHDFRNLCKLDKSKQMESFERRIISAEIVPCPGTREGHEEGMYMLNLVGRAFLYHQVRHIMAVLFMVGKGVEEPSIVTHLLNVNPGAEPGEGLEVVDRKPTYQMADALPLVLWDCRYPDELVQWQGMSDDKQLSRGVYKHLEDIKDRSDVLTQLNHHFLLASTELHKPVGPESDDGVEIPLGGGTSRRFANYTPLLRRDRLDPVDVRNERWRAGQDRKKNARAQADDGDE